MHAVADAPAAQDLRLLAVPYFLETGKPRSKLPAGFKRYSLSLGEGFVVQAIHAIQKACENVGGGGDQSLRARIAAFHLDLQLESGKPSAIYVDVQGEVCTRARYMEPIHGKVATLHEVVVVAESEQVFIYLENSCRDQMGRQAVVSMLLHKANLAEDGVEVSEDRDRRGIVLQGALFVRLPASKYKGFMRMVQPIHAGVPACNAGNIELTRRWRRAWWVRTSRCTSALRRRA